MSSLIDIIKKTQSVAKSRSASCSKLFRSTDKHAHLNQNTSLTGLLTINDKSYQNLQNKLNNYLSLNLNSNTAKRSSEQSLSICLDSPIPFANKSKFEVNDFNVFYNVLLKHNKMNQSLILDTIQMPFNEKYKRGKEVYSSLPHPSTIEASNMNVNYEYCKNMLQKIKRKVEFVENPRHVFNKNKKREEGLLRTRSSSINNTQKSRYHQSEILSILNISKIGNIKHKPIDLSLKVVNRKLSQGNSNNRGVDLSLHQRRTIKKILIHNSKQQSNIKNMLFKSNKDNNNEPVEMSKRSILETSKSIEYVTPTKKINMKLNTIKKTLKSQTVRPLTNLSPKVKKSILKSKQNQTKKKNLSCLVLEQEPELIRIDEAMLFSLRKKNSIKERASSAMEPIKLRRIKGESNVLNTPINNLCGINDNNKIASSFDAISHFIQPKSTAHKIPKKMNKIFKMNNKIDCKTYYSRLKQIKKKTYTYISEAKAVSRLMKGKWNKSKIDIDQINNDKSKNLYSITSRKTIRKENINLLSPSELKQSEDNKPETRNIRRKNTDISPLLSGNDKSDKSAKRELNLSQEPSQERSLKMSLSINNKDKAMKNTSNSSKSLLPMEKIENQELQALKLNQDIYILLNDFTLLKEENQELLNEFKEKICSLRHFSRKEYMNYLIENMDYLEDEIKHLKQCYEQETRINMFVKELNFKREKIMEQKVSKKTKLRVIDGFIDLFQSSFLFNEDEVH